MRRHGHYEAGSHTEKERKTRTRQRYERMEQGKTKRSQVRQKEEGRATGQLLCTNQNKDNAARVIYLFE